MFQDCMYTQTREVSDRLKDRSTVQGSSTILLLSFYCVLSARPPLSPIMSSQNPNKGKLPCRDFGADPQVVKTNPEPWASATAARARLKNRSEGRKKSARSVKWATEGRKLETLDKWTKKKQVNKLF